MRSPKLSIARVYDEVGQNPRRGVLVDRLWPRGLARTDAPFETWAKDVAPSPQLRKWYGHVVERFDEFARRYREELSVAPAARRVGGTAGADGADQDGAPHRHEGP